jgi:hypothetical protein
MKYSDFCTGRPQLFLGQIVNEANNSVDLQWQLRQGDTVVDEGVARTIRIAPEEIEVEAETGKAENVKLSGNRQYLVKTGFKPDTTGLGSVKAK